jgi:hypothetical protein
MIDASSTREKVPGDNPAFYRQHNNRVFFYLHGAIIEDYPGLENSLFLLRYRI